MNKSKNRNRRNFVTHSFKKQWNRVKKFWLEPPAYALNQERNVKAILAADWRQIILIDVIIWSFLAASIYQVAFMFGRGTPGVFDFAKSVGLDLAIWTLSRAIAKEFLMADRLRAVTGRKYYNTEDRRGGYKRYFKLGILWLALFVFLTMTTIVNALYELWDIGAPAGIVRFVDYKGTEDFLIKNLSSSFLSVIIISLTFVRLLLEKSIIFNFEKINSDVEQVSKDDARRERERERMRQRRERLRNELPVKKKRGRPRGSGRK